MPNLRQFPTACSGVALVFLLLSCATKDEQQLDAPEPTSTGIEQPPSHAPPERDPLNSTSDQGTRDMSGLIGNSMHRGHPQRATVQETIELVLRSTPPGATISIDGKEIGVTPTFWSGPADLRPHDYTFAKEGRTMARYRFVPTRSGVVHATLAPVVTNEDMDRALPSDQDQDQDQGPSPSK